MKQLGRDVEILSREFNSIKPNAYRILYVRSFTSRTHNSYKTKSNMIIGELYRIFARRGFLCGAFYNEKGGLIKTQISRP